MKKVFEKLKVFVVILLVILISIIAFLGVFKKNKGVWENLIPDYQYGMDIKGARELRYTLDDSEEEKYVYVDENGNVMGEVWKDGSSTTAEDEQTSTEEGQDQTEEVSEEVPYAKETRTIKANEDSKLTKENFEMAKKIIQKRFKNQDVEDYKIRIDDVTGKLVIETANDNENVELVEKLIDQQGKFKIVDYQNGVTLMDNSDIKDVSVVYSNNESYQTYLQITFNKEGAEKLRQMSTKYVEQESATENEEETETEETAEEELEKKYVSVIFDDTTMMTTYFGEEMTAGVLQISVGQARTEYDDFVEDYNSAKTIADILNSGILPVKYELETDNFVQSEITDNQIKVIKTAVAIAIILISLIFIVKYKKKGLLAAILSIGYIAVLSIVVRYTNVLFTVNSCIAYVIVILINYIFMEILLKKAKEKEFAVAYKETMKEFWLSVIPVGVVAIVFTFTKYTMINSIGMILFWGLILNALYNLLFVRTVLKSERDCIK